MAWVAVLPPRAQILVTLAKILSSRRGIQRKSSIGATAPSTSWRNRPSGSFATTRGMLPRHSYFAGCSTGGNQALSEVQRFPTDYDGVLAGDPGNDRVHLNVGFLWA